MGNSILDRRVRNILIFVGLATVLFGGGLAFFLFTYLGKEEDSVKEKTAQFVTAIERNDPDAAPDGGDEYVTGINNAYGPIKSVTPLERWKKSVGSGSNSRSFWVSEVLLKSERGAAVVQIRWGTSGFLSPSKQKIDQAYEVKPGDVHSSLSDKDGAAVKAGFKARGSDVFDSFDLTPFFQQNEPERIGRTKPPEDVTPTPTPPAEEVPTPDTEAADKERKRLEREQRKAEKRLKCVQDAKGDVNKLQKCVADLTS